MPNASVLTGYGPPQVLEWKEVSMPEPGDGEIRIRVQAAGVGPTDAKIRRGDLADGTLRLRRERRLPMQRAFEAHELLDNGTTHEKLVLIVGSQLGKESG